VRFNEVSGFKRTTTTKVQAAKSKNRAGKGKEEFYGGGMLQYDVAEEGFS
jgi:hypothetical protein